MIQIWSTVLGAAIAAVALWAAHWFNNRNAFRLKELELREARRTDRRHAFTNFFVIATEFADAHGPGRPAGAGDAAMRDLKRAAAGVTLAAPAIARGPMPAVLDAAASLHSVALSNPATAPAVEETHGDFQQALNELVDSMNADLDAAAP